MGIWLKMETKEYQDEEQGKVKVIDMTQEETKKLLFEMEEKIKKNMTTEIKQQKFKNKTTGEIVTQFSLMDIANFEKVD